MNGIYDEKTKLWGSVDQKQSQGPTIPLGQVILNWLSSHGSRVAQVNDDNGAQVTYQDLWLWTIRAAQNLQKKGFKSRQRLCFMVDNDDHLLPIFFASICLACPIVPLNPLLSKDEIARVLMKIRPAAIFCESSLYNEMDEAVSETQINVELFMFGDRIQDFESVENLLMETNDEASFVPVDYDVAEDIAAIMCSSGSTGPSKCVCISYNHYIFSEPARYDSSYVVSTFDSIFWTVGIRPIIDCIYNGAKRIITKKPFSPELQLHLIEKYNVNVLYIPPFNLVPCIKNDMIHKVDLSSVKTIYFYGGETLPTLISAVNHYMPSAHSVPWYGMTEVGRIAFQGNDCGKHLVNGCTAKIVDEDGNRCGQNISGEICVMKKHQFLGYFDDSVATANAIDGEGFFRTGDIGHFDDNGTLFIEGRKKNVMNIFYFEGVIVPSEIEKCLVSLPDIEEACVVGIPITTGTVLPAAVVVRKLNSNLGQREVFDAAKENCPNRSRLRGGVYFIKTLPKTPNGKLAREKVKKFAAKMFEIAVKYDADVQANLSDLPDEYRGLIDDLYFHHSKKIVNE